MYAVRMIEKAKVDRAHRTFVSYIDRSREYYQAQGYDRPYAWAFFDDVPFAPVSKPLKESTLALITTASPFDRQPETNDGIVAPKEVSSGASAAPPERLYTDDLSWDKETTHTEDLDSYFPSTGCKSSSTPAASASLPAATTARPRNTASGVRLRRTRPRFCAAAVRTA